MMMVVSSLLLACSTIIGAFISPEGVRRWPTWKTPPTRTTFPRISLLSHSYQFQSQSSYSSISRTTQLHRIAVQRLSNDESVRGKLRKFTGFSLTTFRTTMRLATGFSLTSTRAAMRALTGVSVTGTMKAILRFFPASFRYFLQPLLILYYVPLLTIQGLVGRTKTSKSDAKAAHDRVVQDWKDAVRVAEEVNQGGYWPVHVDGMSRPFFHVHLK